MDQAGDQKIHEAGAVQVNVSCEEREKNLAGAGMLKKTDEAAKIKSGSKKVYFSLRSSNIQCFKIILFFLSGSVRCQEPSWHWGGAV